MHTDDADEYKFEDKSIRTAEDGDLEPHDLDGGAAPGLTGTHTRDPSDPRSANRRLHEADKQLALAIEALRVRDGPAATAAISEAERALAKISAAKDFEALSRTEVQP